MNEDPQTLIQPATPPTELITTRREDSQHPHVLVDSHPIPPLGEQPRWSTHTRHPQDHYHRKWPDNHMTDTPNVYIFLYIDAMLDCLTPKRGHVEFEYIYTWSFDHFLAYMKILEKRHTSFVSSLPPVCIVLSHPLDLVHQLSYSRTLKRRPATWLQLPNSPAVHVQYALNIAPPTSYLKLFFTRTHTSYGFDETGWDGRHFVFQ